MSNKFILSHKSNNGEQITLDEPISPSRVLDTIKGIMDMPNTHIIQIKKITDKQIEERDLRCFMEKMDDEETGIILIDAILDSESKVNNGIWPFKKIKSEDIPEELTGNNKKIAKWIWNNTTSDQKKHIIDLEKKNIIIH